MHHFGKDQPQALCAAQRHAATHRRLLHSDDAGLLKMAQDALGCDARKTTRYRCPAASQPTTVTYDFTVPVNPAAKLDPDSPAVDLSELRIPLCCRSARCRLLA
jgi:hypothetical protein